MPRKRDMELRAKKRPGAKPGCKAPDGRRPSEVRKTKTEHDQIIADFLGQQDVDETIADEIVAIGLEEVRAMRERFPEDAVKPVEIVEIELGPIVKSVENNNY